MSAGRVRTRNHMTKMKIVGTNRASYKIDGNLRDRMNNTYFFFKKKPTTESDTRRFNYYNKSIHTSICLSLSIYIYIYYLYIHIYICAHITSLYISAHNVYLSLHVCIYVFLFFAIPISKIVCMCV